jgi:hypothetical protein
MLFLHTNIYATFLHNFEERAAETNTYVRKMSVQHKLAVSKTCK